MVKSPIKKSDLPDYWELAEMNDKPTLTGKLLVAIVGQCGAGNGRCVVSPHLPRPGTILDDRWLIESYVIECKAYVLRVKVNVLDRRDKKPVTQSIVSTPLAVTDAAYQEVKSLNLHKETMGLLTKLWGKSLSESHLEKLNKGIQMMASNGRHGGIVSMSDGQLSVTIDL